MRAFAQCDLLASVHGSQNANVMWMRRGAAFMEINPHKFYYSSYNHLSTVAGVLFLHSRRNSIALPAGSPLLAPPFSSSRSHESAASWPSSRGSCR